MTGTKAHRSNKIALAFLALILFFPQAPPIFGWSEIHINLIAFALAIMVIFRKHSALNPRVLIALTTYFLTLQSILIATYLFSPQSEFDFSSLPNLFRPTFNLLTAIAFATLIYPNGVTYRNVSRFARILALLGVTYSLLEVFYYEQFGFLAQLLFRREDKSNIDGVAVTFFTLPYYAAYVYLTFLPVLIADFLAKPSGYNLLFVVFILANIILTQSKMGIFVATLVALVTILIQASWASRAVTTVMISILGPIFFFMFPDFIVFLNQTTGGNFARTTYLMLFRPEQAHNLLERVKDVGFAWERVSDNYYFLGAGLGRGETLEVWIATVLYRYGLFGFVFFIGCVAILTLRLGLRLRRYERHSPERRTCLFVFMWVSTIFLTQMSSFMLESSKTGILSCFMLGFALAVLNEGGGWKNQFSVSTICKPTSVKKL